jgi:hypothetical protein
MIRERGFPERKSVSPNLSISNLYLYLIFRFSATIAAIDGDTRRFCGERTLRPCKIAFACICNVTWSNLVLCPSLNCAAW